MNTMICNNAGAAVSPAAAARTVALGGSDFRPRTLDQAVQDAVDAQPAEALTPLNADSARPFTQARDVLALLVRGYAEQIYSSAKLASRAASDPDFPWPWWEALPDASALSRFRAANRAPLLESLKAALQFQVEERIYAGAVTRVNRPRLAEEAHRRITMAAFADSQELEAE